VRAGDLLQTGPTGSSTYVSGLPVGTVTSVRKGADGTVRASVRPASSPTAVDVVGVVLSTPTALAGRAALQPSGHPR
jgi:rod shape-determining protein MreC